MNISTVILKQNIGIDGEAKTESIPPAGERTSICSSDILKVETNHQCFHTGN